ncbi:CHAT domain-containing protein [Parasphingorhabdus sp.]|uniref:CHAT domain-containing protein n=1 Tax=Parasphingorhabdus sp. TaxID=2709688 RepID=UPI003D285061
MMMPTSYAFRLVGVVALIFGFHPAAHASPLEEANKAYIAKEHPRAIKLFRTACDAGELAACSRIAIYQRKGDHLEKDVERANNVLREMCDAGDLLGCESYGISNEFGLGVEKDFARARRYYDRACLEGEGRNVACNNLAIMLRDGSGGIEVDKIRAFALLKAICDKDYLRGCVNIGRGFNEGSFGDGDQDKAIAYFERACTDEYGDGCNRAGSFYQSAKEIERALNFYRQACDLENRWGCGNAAQILRRKDFPGRDLAAAVALHERACAFELSLSCYRLGHMLQRGESGPADPDRAAEAFRSGCGLDEKTSWPAENCNSLARLDGTGSHAKISQLRDLQRTQRKAGDYLSAIENSTEAVRLLEELGHTENGQFALVLQQHGLNLNDGGRDVEGAEFSRRSYETYARVLGEDHRSTLNGLHNYATLVSRQGNYILAERLMKQVYVTRQRTLGVDHGDTLSAARNQAIELQKLGRFAESEALSRTAIVLASARFGPKSSSTMAQRYQLARVEFSLGRTDPVVATIDEMIMLLRNGRSVGIDPVIIFSFKASLEIRLGNYDAAQRMRRVIFNYEVKQNGRAHRDSVAAAANLASALRLAGKYRESELIYRDNLRISRAAYGDNHPRSLGALSNVASSLGRQGRYAEQLKISQDIVDRQRAAFGENHPSTLAAYHVLAYATDRAGDTQSAERLARQAGIASANLYGNTHLSVLSNRRFHAGLLRKLKRFDEAEDIYRTTLSSQIDLLGDLNSSTITTKLGLAEVLRLTNRAAGAETLFSEALTIQEQRVGVQHPEVIDIRANLIASLLDQPGRKAQAYQPAVKMADAMRARLRSERRETAASAGASLYKKSNSDMYLIAADAAWSSFEAGGPDEGRDVALNTGFLALQDAMDGPANQALATSAGRRLAERSGAELGQLARRRDMSIKELGQVDQALTEALLEEGEKGKTIRERLEKRKATISGELKAIDQRLEAEAPEYFSLVNSSALSVDQAKALVGPEEAILLVAPSEYGTHILAITNREITWHRSDWNKWRVNGAVKRLLWDVGANVAPSYAEADDWEQQGEGEGAYPYDRSTAFALYQALIAPLAAAIDGKTHLFVAAAGSLSSLPIAALVVEEPLGQDGNPDDLRATKWFADKFAITQLPSLQSLSFLRRFSSGQSRGDDLQMKGFGDPVLTGKSNTRGGRRSGGTAAVGLASSVFAPSPSSQDGFADVNALRALARLPGTRTELLAISKALGADDNAIRLASNATETEFKRTDLSQTDILVLATHGLIAGEIDGVAEPGLVFTPPQTASSMDDGFLSSSEVAVLNLNAEWVILSACNTAAGDGSEGAPGLSGLAKTFFFAGARSLLASHWPVRDDVAALITVKTIENKRDNPALSRAEALQLAMRAIREDERADSASDTWAHPNAWAPFTLIGDGAR